jgi:hypothetical protein
LNPGRLKQWRNDLLQETGPGPLCTFIRVCTKIGGLHKNPVLLKCSSIEITRPILGPIAVAFQNDRIGRKTVEFYCAPYVRLSRVCPTVNDLTVRYVALCMDANFRAQRRK